MDECSRCGEGALAARTSDSTARSTNRAPANPALKILRKSTCTRSATIFLSSSSTFHKIALRGHRAVDRKQM
eukprot:1513131-Amphidinium_carterae.1